ncbi:hypothetical protein KDW41_07840 [Burkholderia vietnamiensis]|nr:hypothetical protein [Burkholderia vietnamiensis]
MWFSLSFAERARPMRREGGSGLLVQRRPDDRQSIHCRQESPIRNTYRRVLAAAALPVKRSAARIDAGRAAALR